jgi:CheY-like chemotaxis protein
VSNDRFIQMLGNTPDFSHDLLNRLGAAKMNMEMALRNKTLPVQIKTNLERALSNLLQMQAMLMEPPASATTESNAAGSSVVQSEPSAKTVLLIDDSEDLASLFKAILSPKGYAVSSARDESEALKFLSENSLPTLVLLDYRLGDKTGIDVLDTLENQKPEVLLKCKVVLFTAMQEEIKDSRVFAVEKKSMDIASVVKLVEKYCVFK